MYRLVSVSAPGDCDTPAHTRSFPVTVRGHKNLWGTRSPSSSSSTSSRILSVTTEESWRPTSHALGCHSKVNPDFHRLEPPQPDGMPREHSLPPYPHGQSRLQTPRNIYGRSAQGNQLWINVSELPGMMQDNFQQPLLLSALH